ncbi:MAG: Lrp/AsnC family leucine-responsive transcriptional regulator [Oceanospirillaceae bacterium]|jgi:Lrp/AsnC family leucine-responsive transcriptional regulator
MQLDNQDLQILKILQIDLRKSVEYIANEVGLSSASVQRRLKRLRDNSVISAEVAIVSPKAVGQSMSFIISVELERDHLNHLAQFKARIKNEPQVQQCYYVTGEADFVLIVTATDMEDFDQFVQQLFYNDSNVRRYKTSVVMERTKVGLSLPL